MSGGIMSILNTGDSKNFINFQPTKTCFKPLQYPKITSFGLQKIRLDFNGNRDIRLTEPSVFVFKISRHADLLTDLHIGFTLPNIWSPIYPPCNETNNKWVPYEFKWIENIGTHLIREIEIQCGSQILSKYSGEYLSMVAQRDYDNDKLSVFNESIGNIDEIHRPEYAYGRFNTYPSAFKTSATTELGVEPSIRGKQLYIPIGAWFMSKSQSAFPLVNLGQGVELTVKVTLRSIQELFRVRDVFDPENNFPHIRPDFNSEQFQMYRFLQTPPESDISLPYENQLKIWTADIHLIGTFAYLSKEEVEVFRSEPLRYLAKDVIQHTFNNITGNMKIPLPSNGLITSWIWRLQRNDVFMRNEWNNYTNWPYSNLPQNIRIADKVSSIESINRIGPFINPDNTNTGIFVSGNFNAENQKEIMVSSGILFNGNYRENIHIAPIFSILERFEHSKGSGNIGNGIYFYNFCLQTNPDNGQPSGVTDTTNFSKIELELNTIVPQLDTQNSSTEILCDENGNIISTRQSNWKMYEYAYDLVLFEERYNIITFNGGYVGLEFAK